MGGAGSHASYTALTNRLCEYLSRRGAPAYNSAALWRVVDEACGGTANHWGQTGTVLRTTPRPM
eukprot:11052957-Alexandrium_andersonii.AAC.1